MRILLTNDDGVHAPGLRTLEAIARELSDDIWIVAPETDQSGASHSLTLNDPLRVRQIADRHFAVRGTPTDCIIMALRHLMAKDTKPDLILSGVNRGQNVADDTTYSGTVAGAMEAGVLGYRAIALSQAYGFDTDRSSIRWRTAQTHGARIVSKLMAVDFPANALVNVNFPDCEPDAVAGDMLTCQGTRDQDILRIVAREDGRGNPYYWLGFQKRDIRLVEGTDLWALANNRIALTPVSIDLTHEAFHKVLAQYGFAVS